MDANHEKHVSKFMSLVLRHKPEMLALKMDKGGWVEVEQLLEKMNAHGQSITREELDFVVANNAKKRFEYNVNQTLIRASQGHSIDVDLGYEAAEPPTLLYHGTAVENLESIKDKGLLPMGRQHVHLSTTQDTAVKVGSRHGKPIVLTVAALWLHRNGNKFYQSTNGVWLTDYVPTLGILRVSPGGYPDTSDKRVAALTAMPWNMAGTVLVGKMENGRDFRVTLQGFDKTEADKIALKLQLAIPGIISDALSGTV